jgi:iron complex outermembrane receptor protein
MTKRGACRRADGDARALRLKPGSNDAGQRCARASIPRLQLQLRSSYSIDAARELELAVRRSAALGYPAVPAIRRSMRASAGACRGSGIVGDRTTNLNGSHAEYGGIATRRKCRDGGGLVWQN